MAAHGCEPTCSRDEDEHVFGPTPISPSQSDHEHHFHNSTSVASEVSSTLSSTSPYRRDRFDRLTRRDAFSRKMHRALNLRREAANEEKKIDDPREYSSQRTNYVTKHDEESVEPDLTYPSTTEGRGEEESTTQSSISQATARSKRLMLRKRHLGNRHHHFGSDARTLLDRSLGYQSFQSMKKPADSLHAYRSNPGDDGNGCGSGESDSGAYPVSARPQHYSTTTTTTTNNDNDTSAQVCAEERYYRVIYRGVVALLSAPEAHAARSGTYLGYGEVFASGLELPAVDGSDSSSGTAGPPAAETRSNIYYQLLQQDSYHTTGNLDSPPCSIVSHHTTDSVSSMDTHHTRSTAVLSSHPAVRHNNAQKGEAAGRLSPSLSNVSRCVAEVQRHHDRDNKFIRVDQILTGGYAIDGLGGLTPDSIETEVAKTPKRSNLDYYPLSTTKHSPTTLRIGDEGIDVVDNAPDSCGLGFLLMRSKGDLIVEALDQRPRTEEGKFQYRVVSSTPLPIYAGPSLDAPRIKAMALPGTTHEVSLRISFDNQTNTGNENDRLWFLRLNHRRGWVADKKLLRKTNTSAARWVAVLREVNHGDDTSSGADDGSAVSSVASSSAMTPTAAGARRRHRPPRKRRDAAKVEHADKPPRHIGKSVPAAVSTPVKGLSRNSDHHQAMTPSSNVSILSDDSSVDRSNNTRNFTIPTSPDYSLASAATSNASHAHAGAHPKQYFLMKVTAPRGLKILDTPQYQVSNLIRGNGSGGHADSSSVAFHSKNQQSIFHTMSSRLGATSAISKTGNPAVFDTTSKTRILPHGTIFEASKRMESAGGTYNQGTGLIKLSDGSGWAVVPRKEELESQYRSQNLKFDGEIPTAFEEVGHASIEQLPMLNLDPTTGRASSTKWIRILCRSGVPVACPPPFREISDDETSPSSSRGSSGTILSLQDSNAGPATIQDSDSVVATSVASTFVDAMMFRTPKKKSSADTSEKIEPLESKPPPEKQPSSLIIPCGMCVEVEKYSPHPSSTEYVRLLGGQGWVPLARDGREVSTEVPRPDFRFGSFWFRVHAARGIKVRLGPSSKAPSIKTGEGVYFRFECGEFLRASEVVTILSSSGKPTECFAKLYRNRHALLHNGHEEYRSLQSLTVQSEWVQVFSKEEQFLEQYSSEPRIERHRQGWRYNVVSEEGVPVRKGPSFSSETTGSKLLSGESVIINERVTPAGEKITWLRMKDTDGWLHDVDDEGNQIMLAHSLRHRLKAIPMIKSTNSAEPREDFGYNPIIARLFQNSAT